MQHGRKGMTPKYSQIEGKPFKVACQSRRALVQHTKCAQPPSRFMFQCGNRVAGVRAAVRRVGAAFSRPQRLPRTTRQVQLELQITPATRALLVTVLPAPGNLVHWSTRGVRALVDARRCRCWHGCSRAGQRSRHENTTPGAPPAARSETAHSQKYYNTVDQGTSEALKRFGGAVRGVQRKSSARRHQ